jgi:nitrogen-specific signal transduction histidine kinase
LSTIRQLDDTNRSKASGAGSRSRRNCSTSRPDSSHARRRWAAVLALAACGAGDEPGIGVPAEDRDRIFERFYRGRNATAATGTGLGPAIARWIAVRHGGTIEVLGALGDGSCLSLRLPLTTPSERPMELRWSRR